jgi:hypothetical protein
MLQRLPPQALSSRELQESGVRESNTFCRRKSNANLIWYTCYKKGQLGIGVSQAPDDLLDSLVRLLRLLDRPFEISIMLPMIEREILWRLLCGEEGTWVRHWSGG